MIRYRDNLYQPRPMLWYDYPLGDCMAYISIPRNLSEAEARRLCAFITTLVVPWAESNASQEQTNAHP